LEDGFAIIDREWSSGDKITLVLDMPVSFVKTNPKVRDNAGKTAVMRGPVVYCAEEADNGSELFKLRAGNPRNVEVNYEKDLLEGVTMISFIGSKEKDWSEDSLYGTADAAFEDKKIVLVPYYSWANRKVGEMSVWLNK
jgi:DUF1680 family protein